MSELKIPLFVLVVGHEGVPKRHFGPRCMAMLSGSNSFSSTNWSDFIFATSFAGIGGKLEASMNG